MTNGTFNQSVEYSGKIGGVRKVFEGQVKLLVGGFAYDLKDLPAPGNVLPAGTPVQVDEQARTIKPLITFEVTKVESNKVYVKYYNEGVRVKVGTAVAKMPTSLTTAATSSATVNAIAVFDEETVEITLSGAISGLAVGDILVEVEAESKKVKAVPNALTPYDICLDADAYACDGDAAWACLEFPVLERRMPVINDAIKKALVDAGCFFRFSNRK